MKQVNIMPQEEPRCEYCGKAFDPDEERCCKACIDAMKEEIRAALETAKNFRQRNRTILKETGTLVEMLIVVFETLETPDEGREAGRKGVLAQLQGIKKIINDNIKLSD
jgi:hypothetical protein